MRSDVKASTQITWGNVLRNLTEYFGADKPLRDITSGDAEEWRLALLRSGLAEATVRRRCSKAKQFFKHALRKQLIDSNPFADIVCSMRANRSRDHFVARGDAELIIQACPDLQWRVIFALCRFGGLRCPSELLALRWSDVDWDRRRMYVRSPKTEHHAGKEGRWVPLFPELAEQLEAVWDAAEPGVEFVVTRYRSQTQNLRTTFGKIIVRAGLSPWPKLFQNLRATRATELTSVFPQHVCAAWLGHSTAIAQEHYWQVTEDDFEKALQNPMQHVHATPRTGPQPRPKQTQKSLVFRENATTCETTRDRRVGDEGLEPPTSTL